VAQAKEAMKRQQHAWQIATTQPIPATPIQVELCIPFVAAGPSRPRRGELVTLLAFGAHTGPTLRITDSRIITYMGRQLIRLRMRTPAPTEDVSADV
jgi:hypothetical protein